jgi:hypothetical protein
MRNDVVEMSFDEMSPELRALIRRCARLVDDGFSTPDQLEVGR